MFLLSPRPIPSLLSNDFLLLFLCEALAFADLMAFLNTSKTILILPELVIINECHPIFVSVVILMPSVVPDQSVSLEKARGILQGCRISLICQIRVQIRICQGRFQFTIPEFICLLDEKDS